MSYRNPKQVIDRRSSIVNNAVGQMLATISKNQQTFALAKKKEKAAQQLVLDKATASARSGYDQSFQKAQAAGNKFTSQLTGEDKKVTKDAISFNTQIQTHLSAIGEELNTEIERIQKDGGTTEQIQQAKNAAIMKMNKFTVDMQNWEAARQEYMLAKKENPDDPGSLLSNVENQDNIKMIELFETMLDDTESNLVITNDELGNTIISAVQFDQNGDIVPVSDANYIASENITAMAENHQAKGSGTFFKTNENFTQENYREMNKIYETLQNREDLMSDTDIGRLDKLKVKEYLQDDPEGQRLMNFYAGQEEKWISLGADSEVDYLESIMDNAWSAYEVSAKGDPVQKKVTDKQIAAAADEEYKESLVDP